MAVSAFARHELRVLQTRALVLRVILAVLLHVFTSDYTFAPDQETYHAWGGMLARYWAGETLVYPSAFYARDEPKAYYHIVGVLYLVFGEWAILPKLLNAVTGVIAVRLVFDIAALIAGTEAVALRAARYTAYFPSLVLWSVLNIRDSWVVMLILLVCRQALALQERFTIRGLVLLAVAVLAMTQFRSYILFAVTLPMVVSFLVRNNRHLVRNTLVGMVAAMIVIYADHSAGSQRRLRAPELERLQTLRHWSATAANSGFARDVDISTPAGALAFLPVGLTYFLLAPFPWTVTNARQAFTIPEMLYFYGLLPSLFTGAAYLLRRRARDALMIFLITLGLTVGYALGQGNVGTIYRHRAQVLPFFLIFAAVGVERRREKALERAQAPAPVPGMARAAS